MDRDGTIIFERHYLSRPEQVEFLPSAVDGLREFARLGLGLVVVTNQSGLGRGLFSPGDLERVHQRFQEMLAAEGILLDGLYFCPHIPEADCECRKPKPALAFRAAEDLRFNVKDAFVVGDKPCDVNLGRNVGATTFLVRSGYGAEVQERGEADPDYCVENLAEAAAVIQRILGERKDTSDGAQV